ncbi:MAG: molecular chaperone TorD family protein [Gordonibacter sp.]|nr:molecular chaperone TorD family protein [Gordonibacter sp.]
MTEELKIDAQIWPARTAAWELLALSFRYPDAVLVDAVVSGEWVEAAREIAAVLGVSLPEGFGSDLAGVDGHPRTTSGEETEAAGSSDTPDVSAVLHALRAEATRLFVGAPEPVVSPYEGVHRAAADGVQALLFVNPHSMQVERFMKSCGLGRPEGTNEPLDHVSTECELLMHLAIQAAGAPAPENAPQSEELPGGSPSVAYGLFLEEHARIWIPDFAEQVRVESREPFFCAAAELLDALVAA